MSKGILIIATLLCVNIATLLCVDARADTVSKLWSRGYAVIPEPQRVELKEGDLRFGPAWSFDLGPGIAASDVAVESLRQELGTRVAPDSHSGTMIRLAIKPGSVTPGPSTDLDKSAAAEQAYQLDVGDSGVSITANASDGLFYGVATLLQLLRPQRGGWYLPLVRIIDWPDLHLRHIYWDDAHHLERLPELKRCIRQAAFYKINGFALKLEGHFQFLSAPAVVEPYALSPAEYQELTDYALHYHVQLVPYLDGPGHIAFILKHPEYFKYRSFPDSNYELCATNPDAVTFLLGMFRDLLNANRGGKFVYLSTDEPYYIGLADNAQCHEKAAAEAKGSVGKLLADFSTQIAGPLHDAGRTVIFWGEYPLKPSDIDSLPPYLVNGEVSGPTLDPLFHKRGIRQMIYTSTQAETPLFPDYFNLPDSRRLRPARSHADRLGVGLQQISDTPARKQTELMGTVVAGWADAGVHPEAMWLGYVTMSARGWRPASPSAQESAAAFYKVFYGEGAVDMGRVYQLMSQQQQFWADSWEWGTSTRKPIFGNSDHVYNPRRPAKDQTLPLPPPIAMDLTFNNTWTKDNERRLQLASDELAENDELLALLHENLRTVEFNRYNLEVFLSIAQLYRQNLEMLIGLGRMCGEIESAQKAASSRKPEDVVAALDQALDMARRIRQQRNAALNNAASTFNKSWFPRVAEANGRKFLHDLDDVKDHVGDRTVDLSYLVERDLLLPFGTWIETIRAARNQYAIANQLPIEGRAFDWLDKHE